MKKQKLHACLVTLSLASSSWLNAQNAPFDAQEALLAWNAWNGSGAWDTSTANWRDSATGESTPFIQGSSVSFSGYAMPELTEDVDINNFTSSMYYMMLGGPATLSIYGDMNITTASDGTIIVNGPRLSGPGSVIYNGNLHLQFAAAEHDFSGGLHVRAGNFTADVESSADTPLGAGGGLHIGASGAVSQASATIQKTAAAAATPVALYSSTPPPVHNRRV